MPDFRIADTFADSLAHLTGAEQKVVKATTWVMKVHKVRCGRRHFETIGVSFGSGESANEVWQRRSGESRIVGCKQL